MGFLLVLHWNQAPISKHFRDIRLQIHLGRDLDLLGSRKVIGHVTIWYRYSISYGCSIVTNSLFPAVFEILGPKHIGVTTLTFQGHVTSSITWRFDSPYRVSYFCSIGTKSLSPSVFEIFGSRMPVQWKSSLRMRDITWSVPPMQNLGTYLNFPPPTLPIQYDTFIGLRWRLRGVYSWAQC